MIWAADTRTAVRPVTCRADGKGMEALPVRRILFPCHETEGMVEPLETVMGMLTRVGSRKEAAEGRGCSEAPPSRMGAREIGAGGKK